MAKDDAQDEDDVIVGINVTPLVDITLVLLIIFMVTAKLSVSQSIPLDLPKASPGKEVQVIMSIELLANGDAKVNGAKLGNDEELLERGKQEHAKNPEVRAVIKADKLVSHGRVIHVLDLLKRGDVTKVAFGTSQAAPAAPAPAAPAPAAPPK